MALAAFCPTCQKTVYIEEGDTGVCPVCSTPLIVTVDNGETQEQTGKS